MIDQEGRFMVAVAAIIENENGEILLVKRSAASALPDFWDDIGGRMKQFEEPEDALRREIKEETGLNEIEIVKLIDVFHMFWGERTAANEMIGIAYWCKTRSNKIALSEEHVDYRWLPPEDALKLANHPVVKSNIKQFILEKRRTNLR